MSLIRACWVHLQGCPQGRDPDNLCFHIVCARGWQATILQQTRPDFRATAAAPAHDWLVPVKNMCLQLPAIWQCCVGAWAANCGASPGKAQEQTARSLMTTTIGLMTGVIVVHLTSWADSLPLYLFSTWSTEEMTENGRDN